MNNPKCAVSNIVIIVIVIKIIILHLSINHLYSYIPLHTPFS